MNKGSQVFALVDLAVIAYSVYIFYSLYYKKGIFDKQKVKALENKMPLFKNKKFLFYAMIAMSILFVIRLFQNVLPVFGVTIF